MRRTLRVGRRLKRTDAVDAVAADPSWWLPQPLEVLRPGCWRVYLWAWELGALVECVVGDPWRNASGVGRRLRWDPALGGATGPFARAVPRFEGALRATTHEDGTAELILDGRYDPPAGLLGAALDVMLLRLVARRTGDHFLTAVATRLDGAVVNRRQAGNAC